METVEENRRQRLALLEKEFGSQVLLSERIQKSPAQISQWKNASKYANSEKRRAMDRSTARHIEKMTGKPEGWMDQPLDPKPSSVQKIKDQPLSPEAANLIRTIEQLDRLHGDKGVFKNLAQLIGQLGTPSDKFNLAVETKDFAGKPPKTTKTSGKVKDAKKPVPNKIGD